MKQKKLPGFTLVEILVVVALIAILATITIVALNPAKNFADTRNAKRSAHVNTILDAVTQYTSEEANSVTTLEAATHGARIINLTFPDCTTGTPAIIGSDTSATQFDLRAALVSNYVVAIPIDPAGTGAGDGAAAYNSGYTICKTGSRIQIAAPSAEGTTIIVKR
ncbi:MAG: prepilin-type N-terminal cleavage/methylation domain-containing protein [bacterium]